PVRAARASDSCRSPPARADAEHVRGSALAGAARFLPAWRGGSRLTSVQLVSSYLSPFVPRLKLCVNHLISGTTTLPAIPAGAARSPCRLLGIATGGQAGGELLQVAQQLPQSRHVGRLVLYQLTNLLNHMFSAGSLMHGHAFTQVVQLTLNL